MDVNGDDGYDCDNQNLGVGNSFAVNKENKFSDIDVDRMTYIKSVSMNEVLSTTSKPAFSQNFKSITLNQNAPSFIPKQLPKQHYNSFHIKAPNNNNPNTGLSYTNSFTNQSTSGNYIDSVKSFPSQKMNTSLQNSIKDNRGSFKTNSGEMIKSSNVVDYNSLDKIDEATYKLLTGKFYDLIISSYASKGIQNSLKSTVPSIIVKIFDEIKDSIPYLFVDQFGNYFCQKIYKFLDLKDRLVFIQKIKDSIEFIGTDLFGTYALQNVISLLCYEEEKIMMTSVILDNVSCLMEHKLGVHVVERLIICFNENIVQKLYKTILDDFVTYANESNTLCICKKVISYHQEEETREIIFKLLVKEADILINDPYGNFTIQECLERYKGIFVSYFYSSIIKSIVQLAMQRYSSNVIEKIFELADEDIQEMMIQEFCMNNKVLDVLKNSYGNFVIQKCLVNCKNDDRKAYFVDSIYKNIDRIGERKLIEKWKKILQGVQDGTFTAERDPQKNQFAEGSGAEYNYNSFHKSNSFKGNQNKRNSQGGSFKTNSNCNSNNNSLKFNQKNPYNNQKANNQFNYANSVQFSTENSTTKYNNIFDNFNKFSGFEDTPSFSPTNQGQQQSYSVKFDYYNMSGQDDISRKNSSKK